MILELIKERLVVSGQQHVNKQMRGHDNKYLPDGVLTQAMVEAHLDGRETYALQLVTDEGMAKLGQFDFDYIPGSGVLDTQVAEQHAVAIERTVDGLQQDLGLPQPLVSVSGRKGMGVWLLLDKTVPAGAMQLFLQLAKARYCAGVRQGLVDLRPDADGPTTAAEAVTKMPPCLHQVTRKWCGFIRPDQIRQYLHTPWFNERPDMVEQAALLGGAQLVTGEQFFRALSILQAGSAPSKPLRQYVGPEYGKAQPGYQPPCIRNLIEKGAPEQLDYNTANMTLAGFCHSAQVPKEQAIQWATAMAEHSADHPTSKQSVKAKVDNFTSNRSPAPFSCGYMLREGMRELFGGVFGCEQCAIRPNQTQQPATEQRQTLTVEADVAMDALAYAWQHHKRITGVVSVWPQLQIDDRVSVPAYRMAAEMLPAPTAAGFFSQVEQWAAQNKVTSAGLNARVQEFVSRMRQHVVTEPAYNAAVSRLRELEQRAGLMAAVHSTTARAEIMPVAKLAMDLKTAAEDSLRAERVEGPLETLTDTILAELTAPYTEGVPTPFTGLNDILHGGFKPNRLYVLVAGPKSGKTTLMGQCMDAAAAAGHPVLYLGYEMGRQQMVEYAMARALQINSRWIEQRRLTSEQAQRLVLEMRRYLANEGKLLTIMEAGPKTSLADAAAWVESAKAAYPDKAPLVVVDYLQLASTGDPDIDRHQSDTKRVTALAVACKDLARKTGAAVVALSAITKEAEQAARETGDLDPTAARDALAIIHAADGVMVLNSHPKVQVGGKGLDKKYETTDQWQMFAEMLAEGGDRNLVTDAARKAQQLEAEYPPNAWREEHKGMRVRLHVPRHRGATGGVALYYRRAFHQFEEVPLLPTTSKVAEGRRYAQMGVEYLQQHTAALEGVKTALEPSVAADHAQVPPARQKPAQSVLDLPQGIEADPAMDNWLQGVGFSVDVVTDEQQARERLQALPVGVRVGIDLETTALHPQAGQARLVQLSTGQGAVTVIDLWKVGGLPAMVQDLGRSGVRYVAHNAVFEGLFLTHAGAHGLDLDCTMLAHHVLTGKRESLKTLAKQYLGIDLSKEQQVSDWAAQQLTQEQLRYAALDAVVVAHVWDAIEQRFAQLPQARVAYERVKGAQAAVVAARLAGMPFDVQAHQTLLQGLTVKEAELAQRMQELLGDVNPNSGPQMSAWLQQQLGDGAGKWPTTGTGKLSTGADDLAAHRHLLPEQARPAIDALIDLKDVRKKLSAFGQGLADKVWPHTGRIHCDYHLAGTVTGRMSCSEPNLQQIPRSGDYRGLFKPKDGRVFIIADYAAIELRVAAVLANATDLIEAFKQGLDPHKLTASKVLGVPVEEVTKQQRQMAKAVNFGLLYGMGAPGLRDYAANTYGVQMSEKEAEQAREGWFKAYPAFAAWHNTVRSKTKRTLQTFTPSGRPRQWASAQEYRLTEALNTPVQGGAAEGMLAAMAHLHDRLRGTAVDIVHVVHDELILEAAREDADDAVTALTDCMVRGMLEVFPNMPTTGLVEAHVAASWADK